MPAFELGQRVAVRTIGLGTITDLAGRAPSGEPRRLEPDEPPVFYVVTSATRITMIPIATADELVRPLVSPEEARDLLARLRADGVEPAPDLESDSIAHATPAQNAEFLRKLYALPELDHRRAITMLAYEDIVIAEIAEVLGTDREAIEAEMRTRYPAFDRRVAENRAGRSIDGPAVVATPTRRVPRGIKKK